HARRNILENRLHQFPPPLALFNGQLEALREFVNLFAAFSQLFRHPIERAYQRSEFVLRLNVNLVIEVSSRNFARGLRERLNRYGHLLGEKKCYPSGGE